MLLRNCYDEGAFMLNKNNAALQYPMAQSQIKISSNHLLNKVICLASNENPRGPSSNVMGEIGKESALSHRYPDDESLLLRNKLSENHDVSVDTILIGSGSSEIIEFLIKIIKNRKNANILVTQYSFLLYRVLATHYNIDYAVIEDKDFHQDLLGIIKQINENTKVVFIANPNNPTGTYISYKKLKEFIKLVPKNVMVVIDEAYHEYVMQENYGSAIELTKNHSNLIVLRTFSKVYGLAGLRIGYAIASKEIIKMLNSVRRPFNVSRLALSSAISALDDQDYLEESVEQNACVKRKLEQGLTQLGYAFIPSAANFVTANFRNQKEEIFNYMLKNGVVLRDLSPYGLKNYLRITVGQCKENNVFLDLLSKISR